MWKRLKESEVKYRSLFEKSMDGICLAEAETGIIVDYNQAFVDLVGWGKSALIGKSQKILHPVSDKDEEVTYNFHQHRTIKDGQAIKDEVITKTGEIKKVEIKTSSIEIGDTRYLIGTFRDLTDRNRIESQLRQAQKMESIGTMAGGIAHDFNNILFRMYGYLEMALEEADEDSTLHDYITEVYGEAMRARDLVKQILTFSRQSEHELSPLDMHIVAKEAIKLLKSSIPSTIEISHYIKSDCGQVLADPSQIHQIIMNLATNAFQAMEETGGKLTISLKEIELGVEDIKDETFTPGKYICLTVADTGIGVDPQIQGRIFDPYYTTKGKDEGTGLGLSIILGIVKNHFGYISVDSTPGNGAVFNVYLPVIGQAVDVDAKEETNSAPSKGNEQILLVDDEDAIVQMERKMLDRLGYQITAQSSSHKALEIFRAAPDSFDLVITDLTMPQMTGDKLAVELLKIRPDIPIIMCTGFAEKISWDKAKSIGIKVLLIKPVKLKDISREIRKVLGDK